MQNNSSYRILETQPQEIMSLAAVKNYIRIMNDNDDPLILEMIEAAISSAENYIKYSLTQKIVEAVVYNCQIILLPLLPVLRIIEVKSDDKIVVEGDFTLGKSSVTLTNLPKMQKLVVKYVTGPENASQIPATIKQGMLIHIASMYDNRGNPAAFTERIFEIYRPYRKMVV